MATGKYLGPGVPIGVLAVIFLREGVLMRARARSADIARNAATVAREAPAGVGTAAERPDEFGGRLTVPKEWRVSRAGRFAGWLFVLGSVVGAVIGLFTVFTMSARHWWTALPVAGACALVALCAYRGAVAPSLGAEQDGIVVRNPLGVTELPWALVAEISPSAWGIRIRRTDGRTLIAWAVQKSNWSIWANRWTPADEVVRSLTKEALRRR